MSKKILDIQLPQPSQNYNAAVFNQLIRILQRILNIDIQTPEDINEIEAINFFINN